MRDLIGGLSGGGGAGGGGGDGETPSSTERISLPASVTDGSIVTVAVTSSPRAGGQDGNQGGNVATVEPIWDMVLNGGGQVTPLPTSPPGVVVLNLTPSPTAGSEDGFKPFNNSTTTTQVTQVTTTTIQDTTTTTKATTSEEITVTTDRLVVIEQDDAGIEINLPDEMDLGDTVTVKFTFEDEKTNEVEEDEPALYDNEGDLGGNIFLYDVATDPPRTARPPLFDSLPMFDKDIFSSTFYQDGEQEETTLGSSLPVFTTTEVPLTTLRQDVSSSQSEETGVVFPDPSINLVEEPDVLLPKPIEPPLTLNSTGKGDTPLRPVGDKEKPTVDVRPAQPRSEDESSNVIFPNIILSPLDNPDDGDFADDEQKLDTTVSGFTQYATSTDPTLFAVTTDYSTEYNPEDNTEYDSGDGRDYATTGDTSYVTAGSTTYGSTLEDVTMEVTDYPLTFQDTTESGEKPSNSASSPETDTAEENAPTINYANAVTEPTSITESISATGAASETTNSKETTDITEFVTEAKDSEAELTTESIADFTEETYDGGVRDVEREENSNVDVATTESRPDIRPPILSTSTSSTLSTLSTLSTSISTSTSLSSTPTLSTSTSLSSTSSTSTTPTVDSGSTSSDPLAAPSCPAPAFLCHDATTCLPDNKVTLDHN